MPNKQKNLEGKSGAEEEIKESTEKAVPKEPVEVETPEQKTEREYKENIGQLEQRADDFIKAEQNRANLLTAIEPLPLQPVEPSFNIEQQKNYDQGHRILFWGSVKESFQKLYFKLNGVKNPDSLNHFIHYLQRNIETIETQHKIVEKSQKDAEIEKYKAKGYEVREVSSFWTDEQDENKEKATIELRKHYPYKLEGKEQRKNLDILLSKSNDPIETIEHLKKVGFDLNEHTFDYYFKDFLALASSPEVLTLLQKLEQMGIRGNHYLAQSIDEKKIAQIIIEMAEQESQEDLLKPEIQQKIKGLSKKMDKTINLAEVPDLVALMEDEKGLDLLGRVVQGNRKEKISSYAIRNLLLLQKQGLVEPILKILDSNIAIPPLTKLLSYEAETSRGAEEIVKKELPAFLQSPELKNFLANQDISSFAAKVSSILDQKISLKEGTIAKYEQLIYYPEAIAVLEFCRENQMKELPILWQYSHRFEALTHWLNNKEEVKTLLKPEFGKFLTEIREKLGYQLEWEDIHDTHLSVIKLFEDSQVKAKILSPEGQELINYLEGFKMNHKNAYLELLDTPGILAVLKKLKEFFNYEYRLGRGYYDLLDLTKDQELQQKLFSEKTKALFDELAANFKYKFDPADSKALNYYANTDTRPWQGRVFSPENIDFVNKVVDSYDLGHLDAFFNLEKATRDLILKLSDNFGYKLNLRANAGVIEDLNQIKKLSEHPDGLKELLSSKRVRLIKQLGKENFYRFKPKDTEALIGLPLDFGNFTQELKKRYNYYLNLNDIGALSVLAQNKESVYGLLDGLKEAKTDYALNMEDVDNLVRLAQKKEEIITLAQYLRQVSDEYKFKINDTDDLLKMVEYPLETITEKVSLVKSFFPRYEARPDNISFISLLIDKDYDIEKLKELEQIAQQCNTMFEIYDLYFLIDLRKHENYQDIIAGYQTFNSYRRSRFLLEEIGLYAKVAAIDNFKQKITEWQEKTGGTMTERELKIFIACDGELDKVQEVRDVLDDDYFKNNKDAQNNIQKFLQKFESGDYPVDTFLKIITSSKEARKVKQLAMRTMAIVDLQKIVNPQQRPDYSFLEEKRKYSEVYQKANRMLVEMAGKVLFTDEKPELAKQQQKKIEKLLQEDEQFEDDFRVMTDSIAVYAAKFEPRSQQAIFSELLGAVRQALDLSFIRNPQEYQEERFRRSQEQFNRIFEQLPTVDRQDIEKRWLDTSLITHDSLKATDLKREEILKNKLNEIRVTFETEILPDLLSLFREKLTNLEQAAEKPDKNQSLFQLKLGIFKKYLLEENNILRIDVIAIYKDLLRDIKTKEQLLKSKETPAEEKKQASKELGTMKTLKDALKGIYKLNTIKPEKINLKADYVEKIDDTTGLLSSSLHRLAIVDKEKKPTEEGVGSNLEIDLRDHLQHLEEVISEEDHPKRIKIATQFVTDFSSLARCPELTSSCQRLTEVTGHNESAYSRILDGNDELIDLWEMKESQGQKGKKVLTKNQRLARCFTELALIKTKPKISPLSPELKQDKTIPEEEPRLAVLLDRVYVNPQFSVFQSNFAENIIKTALARFQDQPEIVILFSPNQFSGYLELIKKIAFQYRYKFREESEIQYFVNESHLKIRNGKYYDALGGHHNTTKSYYDSMKTGYILEKLT